MNNKINQELQKIEIPIALHERSKLGVKIAKAEQQKRGLERLVQLNYKRWIAVASVFGMLLLTMIGMPFFNKNGEVQVANFAITAYASSYDGNQISTNLSSEKATIELSTEGRGITTDITGDSGHFIYTKIMLKVSGEHIDSITYTINKGLFLEDVILTAKEVADKDWLLSEKIRTIGNTPGSDIYFATKEIGNTYTVKYNEQDNFKYSFVIPHDGNLGIYDDIIIKVTVKYTDGKSEEQDIIVTQESNAISLKLN